MENIFNILLILFIVYALLSPFLRKKKPQQVQRKQESQREEFAHLSFPQESQPSQDVLAEIEDLLGIKTERESFPEEPLKTETVSDYTSKSKPDEQFQFKTEEEKIDSFKFKAPITVATDARENIKADFSYPMVDLHDYEITAKLLAEETAHEEFDLAFRRYSDLQRGIILKEILDKPRAFIKRR
jgi:hypothetical protein